MPKSPESRKQSQINKQSKKTKSTRAEPGSSDADDSRLHQENKQLRKRNKNYKRQYEELQHKYSLAGNLIVAWKAHHRAFKHEYEQLQQAKQPIKRWPVFELPDKIDGVPYQDLSGLLERAGRPDVHPKLDNEGAKRPEPRYETGATNSGDQGVIELSDW